MKAHTQRQSYTDMDLGSQHGRLGFEAKYPNNANYMYGFAAGSAFFSNWLKRNEPFLSETLGGTNEVAADFYHINMPV